MTRTVLGSLLLGILLCPAMARAKAAEHQSAQAAQEINLSECTVYWHVSSGTLVAIHDGQHFFGTPQHVVSFERGRCTGHTRQGLMVRYTECTSSNKQGLLICCSGQSRFYEAAEEAALASFPQGRNTVIPVCHEPGDESCRELPMPCDIGSRAVARTSRRTGEIVARTNGSAARTNGAAAKTNGAPPKSSGPPKSNIVLVAATGTATAPGVTLIEGEPVKPDEAMVFTRSVLLEEGPSVALMRDVQENIDTVRYNMNTYRIGYALPAAQSGDRYFFNGSVKGWRATSTGGTSAWPPFTYRVSRDEARRRAGQLKPIAVAEPIDEMNNLRVYYYPIAVGHDGRAYQLDDSALAFFIHPKTGYRMTVMVRGGRTYGSVNGPLACTSQLYVHDVKEYPAALGLVRIRVPSIFYSKGLRYDVEAFAQGDTFDQQMAKVLDAHTAGPLAVDDFKALYNEMCRYTGGPVE